jgi:hypothetical protein
VRRIMPSAGLIMAVVAAAGLTALAAPAQASGPVAVDCSSTQSQDISIVATEQVVFEQVNCSMVGLAFVDEGTFTVGQVGNQTLVPGTTPVFIQPGVVAIYTAPALACEESITQQFLAVDIFMSIVTITVTGAPCASALPDVTLQVLPHSGACPTGWSLVGWEAWAQRQVCSMTLTNTGAGWIPGTYTELKVVADAWNATA